MATVTIPEILLDKRQEQLLITAKESKKLHFINPKNKNNKLIKQSIRLSIKRKISEKGDNSTLDLVLDYSKKIKDILPKLNFEQLKKITNSTLLCLSDSTCYLNNEKDQNGRTFDPSDTPMHKTLQRIIKISLNYKPSQISTLFESSQISKLLKFDNPYLQDDLFNLLLKVNHSNRQSILDKMLQSEIAGDGLSKLVIKIYHGDKEVFNHSFSAIVSKLSNMDSYSRNEVFYKLSKLKLSDQQTEEISSEACAIFKNETDNNKLLIRNTINNLKKLNHYQSSMNNCF